MDLQFTSAKASLEERAVVDAVAGSRNGKTQRDSLLPVLHAVQDRFGWISPGALNYVGERLRVAPADVYGVATFYASLSTSPKPQQIVHVCDDIACLAGSEALIESLQASGAVVERSPCLGLCDRAPASLGPDDAWMPTYVGGTELRLLRHVGIVDPESLDAYCADGGYGALRKAFELGPQRVIAEVVTSNLLGRGGAAFPMGRKMEAVANAPERPHYLVCNADESEPGTFKDRVLMESDPYAIVEAMTIAGYTTGCERGYIYIRGEYPVATQRMSNAIARARDAGLLGEAIMGSKTRFDIEVRRGAGAYICGEETALFNSIEGKRGEPRSKPPFPVKAGLFGKPTQINNVETLANLLPILLEGGERYAQIGTPQSTGTRLFCLSGAVTRAGVYEVPHGTTLGAAIDLAGGVPRGRRLQAVLLGGAAGTFVAPDARAMPLTFEDARAAGATLGSGVVMLFDDQTEMMPILRRIARFFEEESCGQCVPCRVGTVRQSEALERRNFALLDDIGAVMRDASICGLGQTAANAIASAGANLKLW
ncbi:MAG: NAD(P)H-dependent oxidoreductase subunit E [Candidatus Eremiobacteraeota bacterium]|nr:NAD(P)H-dependent oxidoreductase subunit E [Candidatus Eremiobacteraeota bacterium]